MAAALQVEPGRELIVVEIGGQRFAIDIMSVREIRGWSASTRLPQAPAHVLGMINLRGSVLPVVDFCSRLGLGENEPNAASVVIVTEIGERMVGLLVDAVCDILTLGEGMLQPTPEVGAPGVHDFVRGVITSSDGIITLLSLDKVIPEDEALAA
ncbi:MAG: chemotaxis protein CheW [Proteobacteria bacterium]|nr:chemotaxis protein CheW [Pseudomonadota bacterium]